MDAARAWRATWCAASTAPATAPATPPPGLPRRGEGAGRQPVPRPSSRCAPRSELALGRRALLPAHRQAAGGARRADRRQLPARAAQHLPGVHQPNKLVIKLQPEDGLELHLLAARARAPATRWRRCSSTSISTRPSPRTASAPTSACCSTPSPGGSTCSCAATRQEQAWRWVEPVLDAWAQDGTGPRPYAAGTWGPAASALVARDGFAWAEEQ